jgi:Ca2+-transporting ATPase
MTSKPDRRPLGHYFLLPPRWRWLYWPTLTLSGGGLALAAWLESEALAVGSCAPIAALPGLAGLLYWFDRVLFGAARIRPEDAAPPTPGTAVRASAAPVAVPAGGAAPAWHTLQVETVLRELGTAPGGLASAEADRRLAQHGPNELQAAQRVSPWALLAEQFKNVLIIILLLATALSAFLGHGVEAVAIAVIVLFAVVLGFVQEYRAERAIEALRQMAAPTATVLRDGSEVDLPARSLVPGDVVVVHAGDKIPADARLMEAINLQIEEAALTGESVPIEKHTAPLGQNAQAVGDRKNMAYAGTAVTYGRGRALVVATGMQTEFGKIAQMLQSVETGKTPLQVNLDKVGHTLARAAFVVVAIIVALGLLRGQPFIEMLIFGIALAVAVVPEALPAVVTISLALGVQKMSRRNALMRRLPAVETLGSTSVICSDKTGTLTKDEMTVRQILVAGQVLEVTGSGYEPQGEFSLAGNSTGPIPLLTDLLRAAALASDAHIARSEADGRWHVKGDPTEGALVVAAAKAGLDKAALDAEFPRTEEIPFTSETKRMTTLHRAGQATVAYSKGAPEIILASCTRQLSAQGDIALSAEDRDRVLETAREMAGQALRVLAVAARPEAQLATAERDMTFLGLLGMIDPPRPEAKAAIQTCEVAGIKPVMITGDHPLTAQAVARELGLLKTGRVVTGAELEGMTDDDFARQVEDIEVYARVSPAHKLKVVTGLQQKGHIVAMTGDGVNDAPALKKADIGIAMGITGTDVTKEAAAMTLTDDNFASIVAAVEEGRGIFGNIKKYLMYLLSSNIGEIGLMAGASLLGLPLPLSAVQILYVNLATDGLPALALAVDPPESDLMRRKPRDPRTGIFTRPVVTLMTVGGLWSALVNLGLFAWARASGRSIEEAMTMTFVSLVLIQFFKAYNFRSDRLSVLNRPFANKWLNLAIVWELILLVLIVYVPFLHAPFGTFSLPLVDWAIVLVLAFTVSPVLELAKWMERRGWFGRMGA